jgi:CubicO group peptidase (beta-lactamase class C family)
VDVGGEAGDGGGGGALWDRGLLEIDDPVAKFVPEFGVHGKDRITLRHILTDTARVEERATD